MTQPLTILAGLAVRGAFESTILPGFLAETGIQAVPEWTPTTLIMSRIAKGDRADVVVVTVQAMDQLVAQDLVDPATRAELVHSRLGLGAAPGAPHPDISTLDAFKQALLGARSVAYSQAGASGIWFLQVIEKLGIGETVKARATPIPAGFTGEKLLTGEADLAVQQVSELMVVPRVEIIGKFPEEVQQVTSFSAAVMRGSANAADAARLVAAFTGTRADAAYRASGVDPV